MSRRADRGSRGPRPSQTRGRLVLFGLGLLTVVRELGGRPGRRSSRVGDRAAAVAAGPSGLPERPQTLSGVEEPRRWRSRWAFYAVGAGMIAWGARGLFTTASTKPANWAKFFIGGVVAHDLLFSPILAGAVFLAIRRIPAAHRAYVQAGVLITGLVTLVALPMVLSPGVPDDPSALPLPYGGNLLLVVAVIWLAVLGTAVVDSARRRSGQPRAVIE